MKYWDSSALILLLVSEEASGQLDFVTLDARQADRAELETRPWMTPGEYTRFSVIDSGVGMDEAARARVFEPFFTTKPVRIGTGLGLPMVYGLVKQQRGFIEVESVSGQGTAVHLYFPQHP